MSYSPKYDTEKKWIKAFDNMPLYKDRVYGVLEDKARQIVRLESKLAYANQTIDDLKKQLEKFYNE